MKIAYPSRDSAIDNLSDESINSMPAEEVQSIKDLAYKKENLAYQNAEPNPSIPDTPCCRSRSSSVM